jgi:hypothetical protein
MQRQIAGDARADRPGKSAVERFAQFYFLNAKAVGDLTGLSLPSWSADGRQRPRWALPTCAAAKHLRGFTIDADGCHTGGDGRFTVVRFACPSCSRLRPGGWKSATRACDHPAPRG